MKKFNVALDETKVEQLRERARRTAVKLNQDITWVDLLREAADTLLAREVGTVAPSFGSVR